MNSSNNLYSEKFPKSTVFLSKQSQLMLIINSKNTCEFIKRKNIQNIVLIDRAARPAWIALRTYWMNAYPKEKFPNVYFIQVEGLEADMENKVYADFASKYQTLIKSKDQPTLIYDACVHRGVTLQNTYNLFEDFGFSKLYIGVADGTDLEDFDEHDVDLISDATTFRKCCYPFGKDDLLKKMNNLVHSTLKNEPNIPYARSIRKEIKKVINHLQGTETELLKIYEKYEKTRVKSEHEKMFESLLNTLR